MNKLINRFDNNNYFKLSLVVIFLGIVFLSFSSCNKNIVVSDFSNLEHYNKLSELFKNLDLQKLSSTDAEIQKAYILKKNKEIAIFLCSNYPLQFKDLDESKIKDPAFFYFGLIHAIAEDLNFNCIQNLNNNGIKINSIIIKTNKIELPEWSKCVIGIMSEYFSIESLVNDYIKLFTSTSVEWSTLWPVVSNTLRRYAGWAFVALAAIEIANSCF